MAVHGKALEAKTIRELGHRASRARRNRLTWARTAASSMRYSGVPHVAARSASLQPPTTSSPSGSTLEAGGKSPRRSARAAMSVVTADQPPWQSGNAHYSVVTRGATHGTGAYDEAVGAYSAASSSPRLRARNAETLARSMQRSEQ